MSPRSTEETPDVTHSDPDRRPRHRPAAVRTAARVAGWLDAPGLDAARLESAGLDAARQLTARVDAARLLTARFLAAGFLAARLLTAGQHAELQLAADQLATRLDTADQLAELSFAEHLDAEGQLAAFLHADAEWPELQLAEDLDAEDLLARDRVPPLLLAEHRQHEQRHHDRPAFAVLDPLAAVGDVAALGHRHAALRFAEPAVGPVRLERHPFDSVDRRVPWLDGHRPAPRDRRLDPFEQPGDGGAAWVHADRAHHTPLERGLSAQHTKRLRRLPQRADRHRTRPGRPVRRPGAVVARLRPRRDRRLEPDARLALRRSVGAHVAGRRSVRRLLGPRRRQPRGVGEPRFLEQRP